MFETNGTWLMLLSLRAAEALPWVLGLMGCAGILGWSPLGRTLFLRAAAATDHAASIEELVSEVTTLRREVLEVQDRLDYSERLLATERVAVGFGPGERGS